MQYGFYSTVFKVQCKVTVNRLAATILLLNFFLKFSAAADVLNTIFAVRSSLSNIKLWNMNRRCFFGFFYPFLLKKLTFCTKLSWKIWKMLSNIHIKNISVCYGQIYKCIVMLCAVHSAMSLLLKKHGGISLQYWDLNTKTIT